MRFHQNGNIRWEVTFWPEALKTSEVSLQNVGQDLHSGGGGHGYGKCTGISQDVSSAKRLADQEPLVVTDEANLRMC